jgi:hypothetical protein
MNVTIDKILRSGPLPGGHVVIIDLLLSNGEELTIECAHEKLPHLAMAINDAGVIAERARAVAPGQAISTEVPYLAVDVATAVSTDSKYLVARFPTTVGPPVIVAMPSEIARKTIELLSIELENAGRRQAPKPS